MHDTKCMLHLPNTMGLQTTLRLIQFRPLQNKGWGTTISWSFPGGSERSEAPSEMDEHTRTLHVRLTESLTPYCATIRDRLKQAPEETTPPENTVKILGNSCARDPPGRQKATFICPTLRLNFVIFWLGGHALNHFFSEFSFGIQEAFIKILYSEAVPFQVKEHVSAW